MKTIHAVLSRHWRGHDKPAEVIGIMSGTREEVETAMRNVLAAHVPARVTYSTRKLRRQNRPLFDWQTTSSLYVFAVDESGTLAVDFIAADITPTATGAEQLYRIQTEQKAA